MNDSTQALHVADLEKKFGSFTAVNKISFDVSKGEIFGFLGPNGAGKSTTIRMLCGILLPTSGNGQVGGFDIYREQEKIKSHIGYMSQKFSLYNDLTVEENINFYSGIYGVTGAKKRERKEWVIEMADLKNMLSSRTGTLPVGWKQRLALGCSVIHEPEILFLDEPTSGVDPISRQRFWDFIREMSSNGVTVFVTTHYMDEAENCKRLALIYRGVLVASGSPQDLKTKIMKENVIEIIVDNPQDWIDELLKKPEISEIALFGTALHAVVPDADAAIKKLTAFFTAHKTADASVRQILPSLEDVFVSLIKTYDQENNKNEHYAR